MTTVHSRLSRLFVLAAAFLFLGSATSFFCAEAEAQITVMKSAELNPGLCLVDFQGPPEVRAKLQKTLENCDWFTVCPTAANAKYNLRAVYTGGSSPTLEMKVTSADGQGFSFVQTVISPRHDWVIYKAVDTLLNRLFKVPGLCASNLAFVNGARGYKEVFLCNFDGSDMMQLTYNKSISTEPSWGPHAYNLVYTLYQKNYTDVVLADMVRRSVKRISQFPGLNAGAALAHDGARAALILSKDRRVDLYVMTLNGGSVRPLTADSFVESSPCWSPDDRQICFVSDRARRPNLYLLPAAGGTGRPEPLPTGCVEAVSPDWSAVSNKICFAGGGGNSYSLMVMDMSGGAPRRAEFVLQGGNWEAPSWAPDGRHVICTREGAAGRRSLVMVDTWTGRTLPLTRDSELSLPAWSDLHD